MHRQRSNLRLLECKKSSYVYWLQQAVHDVQFLGKPSRASVSDTLGFTFDFRLRTVVRRFDALRGLWRSTGSARRPFVSR